MGSMSASDAAPLPRLGEVYFDVRGESRSMRLSWYADTGVAVFSIWQGGTCTGTFRLPIADLPRMIAALQTGPHGDARETRAAHPDDSLPGGADGYRAERADRYEDEPTGVYHGDLSQAYRDEPAAGAYRDEPAAGAYRDEPAAGAYRDEPAAGAYREDPLTGGYSGDPRGGRDDDDSLTAGYHEEPRAGEPDPLTGRYWDDQADGGYREDRGSGRRPGRRGSRHVAGKLAGGYPDDRSGDYFEEPATARYREEAPAGPLAGGYPDDRSGDYFEEPATARYREEAPAGPLAGGYSDGYAGAPATARYPEEPPGGDYPTGPSGYPDAIDDADYPAPAGNARYSPARPYVAPRPDGTRGSREGRRGARRPPGREESGPSPDSFPYGHPAAEPEMRGRGR
jgi:hypothetical protein